MVYTVQPIYMVIGGMVYYCYTNISIKWDEHGMKVQRQRFRKWHEMIHDDMHQQGFAANVTHHDMI